MKKSFYPLALSNLLAIFLTITALPASAWSNHALGTWQALSGILAADKVPDVKVESLTSFLQIESHALESVLLEEEQWAKANVPEYPQRPNNLAFRPGSDITQNRLRFIAAIRINPHAKLPLYLQIQPGSDAGGKALLPWYEVTTLQHSMSVVNGQFVSLQENEVVATLDVVASASDEPDYVLDLGRWNNKDNEQSMGEGFGKHQVGSPA